MLIGVAIVLSDTMSVRALGEERFAAREIGLGAEESCVRRQIGREFKTPLITTMDDLQ
jgi:hypothetical protein